MRRTAHLLLAVSGHGYGHLAQCAPVINTLAKQLPGLRLTLMSALPQTVLADRIEAEFTCIHAETDPLLRMHSAWEVDVPASQTVFREFHLQRATLLAELRGQLRALRPDLVLANIPWLLLAAAARENIPAVALGSLNWAAIFSHYLGSCPGSREALADMWSGYRAAGVFLAPAPALPMPELQNYRALGPIARLGTPQRTALREQLAVADATRLVLVGLGGIDTDLPLENWPQLDGVVWLFPEEAELPRTDMIDCRGLDMSMIDILASADAVLTKPGYGTYTEAVCNGVPLLTLARPDWPEAAYLNAWAQEHGCLRKISLQHFNTGSYADVLDDLLQLPKKTPPPPTGIQQAVDLLAAMLTGPR
jgi:hypothetical protein